MLANPQVSCIMKNDILVTRVTTNPAGGIMKQFNQSLLRVFYILVIGAMLANAGAIVTAAIRLATIILVVLRI